VVSKVFIEHTVLLEPILCLLILFLLDTLVNNLRCNVHPPEKK